MFFMLVHLYAYIIVDHSSVTHQQRANKNILIGSQDFRLRIYNSIQWTFSQVILIVKAWPILTQLQNYSNPKLQIQSLFDSDES